MSYHQAIYDRDDGVCGYCGTNQNLHIHHVDFKSQGGNDNEKNLLTLCITCHSTRAHGVNAAKYRELFKEIIKEKYG